MSSNEQKGAAQKMTNCKYFGCFPCTQQFANFLPISITHTECFVKQFPWLFSFCTVCCLYCTSRFHSPFPWVGLSSKSLT